MAVKPAMRCIAEHIISIIDDLSEHEIDTLLDAIKGSKRVFLFGAGRSGLAVRAFAMRLVQMGLVAHVVGETTTPAITDKDLLILVSGSGETGTIVNAAKIAQKIGTTTVAITSYPESTLATLTNATVAVKGRTKIDIQKNHLKTQLKGSPELTPLGTLFEDSVIVFFDGIVARLMQDLQVGEEGMNGRHTKLE